MAPRETQEAPQDDVATTANQPSPASEEAREPINDDVNEVTASSGKVAVRINPLFWRWDRYDVDGQVFTHNEPVEVTEAEYAELSKKVVRVGEDDRRVLVRA